MIRIKTIFCSILCILAFNTVYTQPNTFSLDQAQAHFEKLLKTGKNNALANYQLSYINFNKNNYGKAIKYSKKNIGKGGIYEADSYLIWGASLEATNRYTDALEIFEKGANLYPNNYLLQYNFALSCYKYRETLKAIKAIEKAIIAKPLHANSHLLYAALLYEANNNALALLPLYYGLLLSSDKNLCLTGFVFAGNRINQQHNLITVPYYDIRLKIKNVADLYAYMSTKKTCEQFIAGFNPNIYVLKAVDYVNTTGTAGSDSLLLKVYTNFYKGLQQTNNTETFFRYLARFTSNIENEEWITSNSAKLENFANWLDTILPADLPN